MENVLQPILEDDVIRLQPLKATDFESVFQAASDPLIWEQHPAKDRYQRPVFEKYFHDAIQSRGAFLILSKVDNAVMGCTRYYNQNKDENSIAIGYTFITRPYWGERGVNYNRHIKHLMTEYAFRHFDKIYFHVGETNYRSQKAVLKLGARALGVQVVRFDDGAVKDTLVFELTPKTCR